MERHVDVQSGHLQLLQSTTLASHYSKMLTCGFGVAVTPMVWAVIGNALNRKVNRAAPSCTFTYVDDFFGAGSYSDTSQIQQIVHDTINAVLGPEGLSVKKNVHAQTAEILGILIGFPTASVRPKDTAIEKNSLCYSVPT